MGLPNLVHYSDPALSDKVFHSGTLLKEILPLKGVNKLEQQDPSFAMEFRQDAFGGLGGYGFPDVDCWMMYDADPQPFQIERTIGIVLSLEGPLTNNQLFGLTRSYAFNTNWRVQTNTTGGGQITFGRQESELGEFPALVSSFATPGIYIIIVRHVSLERHEFYINSSENPVIINPKDAYYSSVHARLCLGRAVSTRSETSAVIGPVFDAFSLISQDKLRAIFEQWQVWG